MGNIKVIGYAIGNRLIQILQDIHVNKRSKVAIKIGEEI